MNDAKELDIGNDATDADDADITIKSGHFFSNCNRLQLWRLIGSFPTAFLSLHFTFRSGEGENRTQSYK